MATILSRTTLISFLLVVLLPFSSFAETEEEREPRTGTLAGFGVGLMGGNSLGTDLKDEDLFSEKAPPITGSFFKSGRDWKAVVTNNSESKYSVSLRAVQQNKLGKSLKNSTFSTILEPGQKWERDVTGVAGAEQGELEITQVKNLTPKKKEGEE